MRRIVVLGGGAAGFFGAIRAAELARDASVILLEAAIHPLQKVRISGGGRCNVTHHLFDAAQFVQRYPRGAKELRGVLTRFGARDTMDWFQSRGVPLKTEPDGRVFPTSDDSASVVDALTAAARELGVEVRTSSTLTDARVAAGGGFDLMLKGGWPLHADALLLATGSNPRGLAFAQGLGHTLIPSVPSLFTFNVRDARLDGLAGVSVPHARGTLKLAQGKPIIQEGPLLVTHWGLSAPAVLRLSAWGARELHEAAYKGTLFVDWTPEIKEDELRARAERMRQEVPRGTVGAHSIAPDVPRRLWERLLASAGLDPFTRWTEAPKQGLNKVIIELKRGEYVIEGKGPFKEEFVTAGGVKRSEVDWRTMESKLVPGLHFAGEILDVDALTGGFNLQNAWSTGWVAGAAMSGVNRE